MLCSSTFLSDRREVFQRGGEYLHQRGRGFFLLLLIFVFISMIDAVLCRAVISLFRLYHKKRIRMYVRAYVRRPGSFFGWSTEL